MYIETGGFSSNTNHIQQIRKYIYIYITTSGVYLGIQAMHIYKSDLKQAFISTASLVIYTSDLIEGLYRDQLASHTYIDSEPYTQVT
jgi:hypothetical protein